MFNKRINKNRGFTLVEMMVSIAVFSIVMVTAMSALMNVIDANNKARAIKVAINNISLALEGISKDMRMGTDYACGQYGAEPTGDCPGGGNIIKYRSTRAFKPTGGQYGYAYYKIENGKMEECLTTQGYTCSASGDFSPITSTEVTIAASSTFYVLGANNSSLSPGSGRTQPRMIMIIGGTAGSKAKTQTSFDLQTGVSQRIRPQTI